MSLCTVGFERPIRRFFYTHSCVLLSCSSLAPPAGQDGAPAEGAAAGEAEAGAPEGRGQQHGV